MNIKSENTVFEQISSFGDNGRKGKLILSEEQIKTPLFMPVGTRGPAKALTNEQVRSTGAKIVLGNTYHLHLNPGEQIIAKHGGLANFTKWVGPTLTDSGGFQVFSLTKMRKITEEGVEFVNPLNGDKIMLTPEISIQIQHKIGADIIMAFDDVVSLDPKERYRTEEAVERTHRWLERCVAEHQKLLKNNPKKPLLFGIQQGGLNKKLRKKSLDFVQSQSVDGVAVGGLSVGETRHEMHQMLEYLGPLYDKNRVHYLMGVGHPIDMRFAIEHGIDIFDCVLPTRNARHGTVWVEGDHQINLKASIYKNDLNILDKSCDCTTCAGGYSRSYLNHMVRVGESTGGTLLSIHNLRFLQRICESYQ